MAFIPQPASLLHRKTLNIPTHTRRRHRHICIASTPSPTRRRASSNVPPGPDVQIQTAVTFLQSLGLSHEDARRSVTRYPQITRHKDLPKATSAVINFFRDELELGPRQLSRAIRHAPQILFRPIKEFETNINFLTNHAQIPRKLLPSAISRCPHTLWMNLSTAREIVDQLVNTCPHLSSVTLGQVFARVPQALVMSPKAFQQRLDNIEEIGIRDGHTLGRVVTRMPLVLVLDPQRTIAKRTNYLKEQLGLNADTIGRIISATPQVLQWSIDKQLKPQIELIASLVGDDQVKQTLEKVPNLIGTHDMLDRVLWLQEQVGMNEEELKKVLREAPALLTYSVAGNLAPKWTFIKDTMKGCKDDLVQAPREALCANLQQRAMPRYAFLIAKGITDVPVLDVLRGSDAKFCRQVANCEPAVFRRYVDNDTYLLFFSSLV